MKEGCEPQKSNDKSELDQECVTEVAQDNESTTQQEHGKSDSSKMALIKRLSNLILRCIDKRWSMTMATHEEVEIIVQRIEKDATRRAVTIVSMLSCQEITIKRLINAILRGRQ